MGTGRTNQLKHTADALISVHNSNNSNESVLFIIITIIPLPSLPVSTPRRLTSPIG